MTPATVGRELRLGPAAKRSAKLSCLHTGTIVIRLLPLCLLLAASASAEPLRVLDISKANSAEVSELKQSGGDGWWLELGEQLVLVGGDPGQPFVATAVPELSRREHVAIERLVLRARGCSLHPDGHEHSQRGTLLASSSRWELRELAELETLSPTELESDAWRPVIPNSTLARQARLDLQGTAPPQPSVQAVVDRVDPARWFADVSTLAAWDRSSYGTSSLNAARDWIGLQFQSLGLVVSTPNFTMNAAGGGGTITRQNVVGRWTGSSTPDQWVIVGAHYDSRNSSSTSTVNTPGAEDNASGCAGVIELARSLLPSQPAKSLLFICYAGEEQGLRGSTAHVQSLGQSGDLARVDAVVIMDMIGYSGSSNLRVLLESNATHGAYVQQFAAAAATYVPELGVLTSTSPFGSDHVPYLNAGLRTLLTIENDWSSYPHYHRTTDTPANIGPHAQAMGGAILRTNAAALAEIVGVGFEAFRDGFEGPP